MRDRATQGTDFREDILGSRIGSGQTGAGMQHTNGELTPRHREMLDFERTWWQSDEPRDESIRARFDCTADEYYVELNQVLELPGAMDHDPLVVRRFHRRRLRRRRSLLRTGSAQPAPAESDDDASGPEIQGGAHA